MIKKSDAMKQNHTTMGLVKLAKGFLLTLLLFLTVNQTGYSNVLINNHPSLQEESSFSMLNSEDWFILSVEEIMAPPKQKSLMLNRQISFETDDNIKGGYVNNIKLDSILEFKNGGNTNEWIKWDFEYDEAGRLLSSKRSYYDARMIAENITEIRNYTTEGLITKYERYEQESFDLTAKLKFREESSYENGRIVLKLVENLGLNTIQSNMSREERYYYNQEGRLDSLATFYKNYKSTEVTHYTYQDNGELRYEYTNYKLLKHEIQFNDTAQITINYVSYLAEKADTSKFEANNTWNNIDYYYETFDHKGRRLSITRMDSLKTLKNRRIDFRAEYEYNDNDQLLHASYFKWVEVVDSAYWKEQTRIDNTYDGDGNLLFYEKTFNDARTNSWLIDEKRTYYYSSTNKSTSTDKAKDLPSRIFPNPATDFISISNLQENSCGYKLYDMQCRLVGSGTVARNVIDISELKAGIYIVKIHDFTARFVKY